MEFYEKLNGKVTINHLELIQFLKQNGFSRMNYDGKEMLVRITNNVITEVDDGDVITFIKSYLNNESEKDVLGRFVQGVSQYLGAKKYKFLDEIKSISDKDTKAVAMTYFQNTAVRITSSEIQLVPYSSLENEIWDKRILKRKFSGLAETDGQFSDFAFKLSKCNEERFVALQTALGYLMHRYNDASLPKIIIYLDENAKTDGSTNGGSGKTLLFKALSHCRETVCIDGKNLKPNSRFQNQRIKITTDIVNFDDVSKNFTLEDLYAMSTAGVTIERKGEDEFLLKPEDSPKLMITSNFQVLGPGGSSDIRRRYEYEVANFFDDSTTPIDIYHNLFFEEWDAEEWQKFDSFMIICVQKFLQLGLLQPDKLNKTARLEQHSSKNFIEFLSNCPIDENVWFEKNDFAELYNSCYPIDSVSSHLLTKWVKAYAVDRNLKYEVRKPGSRYEFRLKTI